MTKLPFVSIIILNFNGLQWLKACFESLEKLSYPRDCFEVMLWDNGSSDSSIEWTSKNFPRVRIFTSQENLGFCIPNNRCALESRAEYVAFLNNDTFVEPGWLGALVDGIRTEEGIVLCASKILLPHIGDGKLLNAAGGIFRATGGGMDTGWLETDAPEYNQPRDTGYGCGAGILVQRKFFVETGGFDEAYFYFAEDADLGYRAWLYGYKVRYVPEAVMFHYCGGTRSDGLKTTPASMYLAVRNNLYFAAKNFEAASLVKAIFSSHLLLLMLFGHLLLSASLAVAAAVLKGYGSWIAGWRKTCLKRKALQAHRKISDQELIQRGLLLTVPETFRRFFYSNRITRERLGSTRYASKDKVGLVKDKDGGLRFTAHRGQVGIQDLSPMENAHQVSTNNWFWNFYTRARFLRGPIWFFGTIANGSCAFLYSHLCWLFGEPFLKLAGRRPQGISLDLKKVQRILVIRLDKIGDFVMTTPFLRELRKNAPQAKITLLISADIRSLAERCPYVDEVLVYGRFNQGILNIMVPPVQSFLYAGKFLWDKQFDLVLNPRWSLDMARGAYLAYFSGAPWRVGYSESVTQSKALVSQGDHLLYSHALNDTSLKHEIDRSLSLLTFIHGVVSDKKPELWHTQEDAVHMNQILKIHDFLPESKGVVFCLGAGMPKRIWPLENFIAVAEFLRKKDSLPMILIGGPEDIAAGEKFYQRLHTMMKIVNLCGKLNLPQTYALLKKCSVYIGGDTGPMHMAAAAGMAVIEISCHPKNGSPESDNAPERVGPWCKTKIILQPKQGLPPCRKECDELARPHCITQIKVEEVTQAAAALLG